MGTIGEARLGLGFSAILLDRDRLGVHFGVAALDIAVVS